eukprot:3925319-Prymnesium_polylepis.1
MEWVIPRGGCGKPFTTTCTCDMYGPTMAPPRVRRASKCASNRIKPETAPLGTGLLRGTGTVAHVWRWSCEACAAHCGCLRGIGNRACGRRTVQLVMGIKKR